MRIFSEQRIYNEQQHQKKVNTMMNEGQRHLQSLFSGNFVKTIVLSGKWYDDIRWLKAACESLGYVKFELQYLNTPKNLPLSRLVHYMAHVKDKNGKWAQLEVFTWIPKREAYNNNNQ